MTSWVVTIDKQHPNHWTIAKRHGFWDLTRHRQIEAGDLVYFWQAGKSFIAQTRAVTEAAPLQPGMSASWEDSGTRQYASRFEFEVIDENPVGKPKWNLDVGAHLTKTPDLRSIPAFEDSADQAVLASYFEAAPDLSPAEVAAIAMLDEAGVDSVEHDLRGLNEDEKKVVKAYQVMRQGQQAFRDKLYKIYGGCAITGTTVKPALDAAHIKPYSGPQANKPFNGLPLRSDLHRLFDRHLLTITLTDEATYMVRVSKTLAGTPYEALDFQALTLLPLEPQDRPSGALLAAHNEACDWLSE